MAFQGTTLLAGSLAALRGLSTSFLGSSVLAGSVVDLETITSPEGFDAQTLGIGQYDPSVAVGFGTLRSEINLVGQYDPVLKGE